MFICRYISKNKLFIDCILNIKKYKALMVGIPYMYVFISLYVSSTLLFSAKQNIFIYGTLLAKILMKLN